MVRREDMVEQGHYRVIANNSGHEFRIGEIVRFSFDDGDESLSLVCYDLDGTEFWYMNPEELEVA
jgi:hypothetical protein